MNIVFSIVEEPVDSIDTVAGNTTDDLRSSDTTTVVEDVVDMVPPPPQDVDIVRKLMRHGHSPHAGHGNGTGYGNGHGEVSLNAIDRILEKETNRNKTDSWNRLDKTIKIQKLNAFAETYCREHSSAVGGSSSKDERKILNKEDPSAYSIGRRPEEYVKSLQAFFIDALEKNKLQRTKDVQYDKETHEIRAIPALHYNTVSRNYTLRIIDTKRVSTLKSLTPLKRELRTVPGTAMAGVQPSDQDTV